VKVTSWTVQLFYWELGLDIERGDESNSQPL